MGLDMYLKKKIYIGAQYKHNAVVGRITIKKEGKPIKVNFKNVSEIVESVGYWRKANHIHKWFVDNVQGGVDDCREAYVSKEKLIELLNTCEMVMKSKPSKRAKPVRIKAEVTDSPKKLLPTQSGFFFGSTDFDEYYFNDTKDTIKIIKSVLKGLTDNDEIYYQSSW